MVKIEGRQSNLTPSKIMKPIRLTLAAALLTACLMPIGYCLERSESTVRQEITQWMKGHPVMGNEPRTIAKVEVYPNESTPGAVSVVSMSPKGTVVVNRDTRLPLVVLYTPDTTIQDLREFGEPASHAANMLATLGANETYKRETSTIQNNVYVPAMLSTSWGQRAPFNLYMPKNPAHNNETAVTGCGTIAMAQILNYHQWPPYGTGNLTHTDLAGTFHPTLKTNLGNPYRWDLMKMRYTGTETGADAAAVAQLVYDIATIGAIDCEYNSSAVNLDHTGNNLATHMFYERENVVAGNKESRRTIEEDLLKGIPVPADICINQNGNGHAIVFDGLLVHNGETSYHTNYGWYGQYNFWWDKDALLDVWQVKPGIRPALIPLPSKPVVKINHGNAVRIPWKISAHRQAEIQELNLYQKVAKTGTWEDDCESLPATTDTRSWSIDPNGWTGKCWKANSPFPSDHLTVVDEFIPTKDATIQFQERHQCADNYAQIEASVDGGEFQSIYRFGKSIRLNWETKTLPLGGFAGKRLKLRVSYYAPPMSAYYSNEQGGGIWIDNLSVNNTLVHDWELVDTIGKAEIQINGQDALTTPANLQNLPIGTHTFTASLTDTHGIEHRAGNDFTMEIASALEPFEKFRVTYKGKIKPSGTTLKIATTKKNAKRTLRISIKNIGTETMEKIQVTFSKTGSNDYSATLGKAKLNPGDTTTLAIQFKPSKTGLRKAFATITTRDGCKFQMKIVGYGS